jgi:hypothetical protein
VVAAVNAPFPKTALADKLNPPMLWPVWSFANPSNPVVAYFFDYYDAVDFVNENLPERNFYIGSAKADKRLSGYRAGTVELHKSMKGGWVL